ncbi:hypothetical protein A5893_06425 [Pedobacter psychrophilus]|uniref:Uncharacterized protein n=1 Tax=Pedobacter psychrophilus TaxID=1826909 RepID=A0A179DHP9_9SPHI|nr:hypothetical protein [Pedobacter psychrophilus]OAQ40575.1 hypothetical protein A5893_06425 [Pedobacter psychrophilus]
MNLILCILTIFNFLITVHLNDIDKVKFESCKKELIEQYQLHQAENLFDAKKTDLEFSDLGFLRYKKTNTNGKVEYYSVKIENLQNIDYLGNENAGWLIINCKQESIIFQTYNDKNGNEDEMVDQIKIPLKNTGIESLNIISLNFQEIKNLFLTK